MKYLCKILYVINMVLATDLDMLLTENMRTILDKITNYTDAINEATPKSDEDNNINDKSLDDLLTKEAGPSKYLKNIDPNLLANKLHLPNDYRHSFASAIHELGNTNPNFTKEQAEALALGLSNIINPPQTSQLDKINELKETIKKAIAFAPSSKEYAIPLIQSVIEMRNSYSDDHTINIIENITNVINNSLENKEYQLDSITSQIKENINRDNFHLILSKICETISTYHR